MCDSLSPVILAQGLIQSHGSLNLDKLIYIYMHFLLEIYIFLVFPNNEI